MTSGRVALCGTASAWISAWHSPELRHNWELAKVAPQFDQALHVILSEVSNASTLAERVCARSEQASPRAALDYAMKNLGQLHELSE